ncbi:uncharacterized protein LOC131456809 [Solea solea]|uniref:uncharacterized protein LOC131456809 n=1 Tax=Solea solea TaxID=90069 RepID=UPI00272AAF58|nr:uncharacterized protein LOC131456809 [Solea solea]
MSVNSSSDRMHCQDPDLSSTLSLSYSIGNILLITPASIFVLHLGQRRWRQQRSCTTTSHSDVFTYHSVVLNLIYGLGALLFNCGAYINDQKIYLLGSYLAAPYFPGLTLFQVLTCVERYLAVVHPITYLGLRQSGGVRIRNVSIAFGWLWISAWVGIFHLYYPKIPHVPYFVVLATSLVGISFCSISVLCVLIHPGPGDVGGNSPRVDRSKRNAFNTMTAILAVLCLFFVSFIVALAVENSQVLSYNVGCAVLIAALWFSLPVSLVLPMLFIHRSGKLLCWPC